MIFGLVLSVVLTGALATYLANYIQKHLWIVYIGLGFILLVAIQLVIGELEDLDILSIMNSLKILLIRIFFSWIFFFTCNVNSLASLINIFL